MCPSLRVLKSDFGELVNNFNLSSIWALNEFCILLSVTYSISGIRVEIWTFLYPYSLSNPNPMQFPQI